MSATINSETFSHYFSDSYDIEKLNSKENNISYAELVFSGVSNYNIKQHFLTDLQKNTITRGNYIEKGVQLILEKIINTSDIISSSNSDIIMFAATETDLKKGCFLLKELCSTIVQNTKKCDELYCVEVYSKMKEDNKKLAVDVNLYKN